MSSSDQALRNRAALGRPRRRVPGASRASSSGDRAALGRCGSFPSRSSASSATSPGKDVLELGCGAAQWSILLARAAARASSGSTTLRGSSSTPAGVDGRGGCRLPARPRGPRRRCRCRTRSFDIVFCRPRRAHRGPTRTRRSRRRRACCGPAGCSRSTHSTPFAGICWDEEADAIDDAARRAYFGMHRFDGQDDGRSRSTCRTASGSACSASNGFARRSADRAPAARGGSDDLPGPRTREWARQWPMEEIWGCAKRADRARNVATGRRGRETDYTDARAEQAWATGRDRLGDLGVPESEVHALPDVVREGRGRARLRDGLRSAPGSQRRGARRVVGVDLTPEQLETARRMQAKHGLEFPLVQASARGRAAAGRVVRPRGVRVRRVDLVRPVPVDPRGGAAAPPGRRARVPAQLRRSSSSARRTTASAGRSDCSGPSSACTGSSGRRTWTRASSTTSRTATGSALLRENGFEIVDLIEIQAPRRSGDARALRLRLCRVGEEVAVGGDLAGPEAGMSIPPYSAQIRHVSVTHSSHPRDYAHLGGRAR